MEENTLRDRKENKTELIIIDNISMKKNGMVWCMVWCMVRGMVWGMVGYGVWWWVVCVVWSGLVWYGINKKQTFSYILRTKGQYTTLGLQLHVLKMYMCIHFHIYSFMLFKQTEEIKTLAAQNRNIEQTTGNFLTAL